MAIGISKIIGFDFKSNFNLPYIARNVSEFWQRWHISLSSWFKDYMYIPLGGNRKGTVRTCINLMIVMTVSGLWHGAAWTYVAWGVVYGVLCVINKLAGKWFIRMGSIVNGIITFLIVTLLWVVFRADSFTDALDVYKGIFTIHDGISQPYTWSFFAIVCFVIAIVIAWHHSKKMGEVDKKGNFVINGFYPLLDLSRFWHLVIFLTFCGITVMMGYFGDTAFIYGSF